MPPVLKTAAAILVAAVAFLAAGVSTASARNANDCWRTLISDWYDGRIDHTYPIPCYSQAIQHLKQFEDLRVYSDAEEDIHRALLAAIRQDRGHGGPDGNGGSGMSVGPIGPAGKGGGGGGGSDGGNTTFQTDDSGKSGKGVVNRLIDRIGPSNAESVPLPLLVLGGIALLLLATAAASFVARRIQARRVQVAPVAARTRDDV